MPAITLEDLGALVPGKLGPESLSRYLRRHGLRADTRRSQNFLVDGEVLEAIVEAVDPSPGRHVLEIGPGLGVLTEALLRAGARITAVEVDARMVAHLRGRQELRQVADADMSLGRAVLPSAATHTEAALRIIHADILDTPLDSIMQAPYDVAANLPYHITSPVLHHLLGREPTPERFVLMVQREVAERIVAAPGGMSYLSVFVQYHAQVRLVRVVPPTAFEPAPAVESAVLAGTVLAPRLAPAAEEELWRLVQAGFRERRKMVHNVLPRQLPQVGRGRFDAALSQVGVVPDRRPQTLSVDEWLALAEALGPLDG
ncbi:16S rRNA (adenine(1518)-N(6)/adenine(1519)-N(6))-dimethyltransferaseRsmA [soil metagenome]